MRAAEASFWYEGHLRDRSAAYGFNRDRRLEKRAHLFWARRGGSYRFESGKFFRATAEAGGSAAPDRLAAYRLGGVLPFASEFPLSVPGYFNGELLARRYVLMTSRWAVPIDAKRRFTGHLFGAAANVTYLRGLEQPGPWNRGVGAGLGYDSLGGILHVDIGYAFGIDALRGNGRGAHSAGVLAQLDLVAWRRHEKPPRRSRLGPQKSESLDWLYQLLRW